MSRPRDGRDLSALAGTFFSRGSPSSAGADPRSVLPAPPHSAVWPLLILGCPPSVDSERAAASIAGRRADSGTPATLVRIGGTPDSGPRGNGLCLPAGPRPGTPPWLDRAALRRLRATLRVGRHLVIHAPGADGPLQRGLALAAAAAILIPGTDDRRTARASTVATLRACLEGSHRLAIALAGEFPGGGTVDGRIASLSPVGEHASTGLADDWEAWLTAARAAAGPLLERPWTVVRLLAGSTYSSGSSTSTT